MPAEELKGTTKQGGRPWREPRDVVNAILWGNFGRLRDACQNRLRAANDAVTAASSLP